MSFQLFSLLPPLIPSFFIYTLALYVLYVLFISIFSRKLPHPPGPPRWPIIGNVFDMPRATEWITFSEWGKVYGSVVYLSIFGRSIIVLNSAKAAFDLLDKRSSIYSDRPRLIMAGDLMGWDHSLGLTPYNERFRETRRLAKGVLGPGAVSVFESLEEILCARFLRKVLDTPQDFLTHIRYAAGAIILSISYGYDVPETGPDLLVQLAETCMDEFSIAARPGQFLVDSLPWLRYIPASLPGMGFQRTAATWRQHLFEMAEVPHQFTKKQMAQGTARTSFVSKSLEQGCTPQTEEVIKWAALSLYGGGADTTVGAISTFFLAMCTHPHVQRAAQAELDTVIGNERLPSISDRAQLPYIDSLVKEVLRWGPVAPLGIAHRLMQEDVYEGYSIPSDSIVIPNIWGMLHDPEIFPNPEVFRPERFLENGKVEGVAANVTQLVFGFGRRICPGKYLAEPFLFLAIATSLATLNIAKACDEFGNIIEPEIVWMSGTVSHPKPFKCKIEPRSKQAGGLVGQAIAEQKNQ